MINVDERMIGDIRVTRVEEVCRPVATPQDWYIDYNREELEPHLSWLSPRYFDLSLGRSISSIHTWVLRRAGRVILIDTCTGNHKNRPEWPVFHMLDTPYLERLRAAGVAPEEVDLVMCTHLHVDHVGWNTRLENGQWVPTFPNARYMMSRTDHDHFEAISRDPRASHTTRNTYIDSVLPVVQAGLASFVNGTEELDHGLHLCPAPGHTPGQVRIDLSSGGQRAVFCGDALHHPLQVPLWHWRTRVCSNPDQARQTRRALLEHCAETDAMLLPAHFAAPHGGHIRARGDTFSIAFDRMWT